MAKKRLSGKFLNISIIALLVIGISIVVFATLHTTDYQQHASQFTDLNTAADIVDTNNPDGTMGPISYLSNYSNTLPSSSVGLLAFQVMDPAQGARPTDIPSHIPTGTLPTQAQAGGPDVIHRPSSTPTGNSSGDGPQSVKTLLLTITKVEVHLTHASLSGGRVTPPISPQDRVHGRPSGTPIPLVTPRSSDTWETLNISAPQTVDLVQLAATKNFSQLGITKLAAGMYVEVRLYISKASAVLTNGTPISLTIPGRANIVRVVEPFAIMAGKTTTLSMDFDAQNSIIKAGDIYLLKPVVARFIRLNQ